jgi:hypothetical protein
MYRQASTLAFAALAIIATRPAIAASDPRGLDNGAGSRSLSQSGFGAEIGMTIRFGDRSTVEDSERVRLGIAAGPILQLRNGTSRAANRRVVSNAIGFTLKPGYSASATVAGQPVLTRYTELGAAERQAKEDSDGPSTLGWIGIAVGATAVALGAAYLALEDALDCTENGRNVCE